MRGLFVVMAAAFCAIVAAAVFISQHRDILAAGQTAPDKPAETPAQAPAPPPPAPAVAQAAQPPSEPEPTAPSPAAAVPAAPSRPAAAPQKPPAPPKQSAPASAPTPAVRIVLPPALRGLQYGMSGDAISARFPISWTRERGGAVTLVHYPEGPEGMQVRFESAGQGLCGIELYMKPPEGKTLAQFHQDVRQQYAAVYGSLPGTAATGWNDGQTILAVTLAPAHVVVSFRPAR
jgi:hypothetical protein